MLQAQCFAKILDKLKLVEVLKLKKKSLLNNKLKNLKATAITGILIVSDLVATTVPILSAKIIRHACME